MSCPVCNHTMQNLGVPDQRIFWCPRCGTLREYGAGGFCRDESPRWARLLSEGQPEAAFRELRASHPSAVKEKSDGAV
jgi:hypothetical protein